MKELTKEIFEQCVPVAESAHRKVFDRLRPHVQETIAATMETVLGPIGKESIEKGNAEMEQCLIDYSCNLAFLELMEQNDVVLTPTGFGVVSNDQMAPASAGRVAAVKENVHRRALQRLGNLIDFLRHLEGWGETDCAATAIAMPVWSINQSRVVLSRTMTTAEWAKLMEAQRTTVTKLERLIGEETIERILLSVRCGRKDDYTALLPSIYRLVAADYDGELLRSVEIMRRLKDGLERNITLYPVYEESSAHQAFIETRYENRQEDPCFIM